MLPVTTNGLFFPARRPRINLNHPAANALRFAAAVTGSGGIDLFGSQPGTIVNTVTVALQANVGPCALFRDNVTDALSFAGHTTANDNPITIAAIIVCPSTATSKASIFTSSSSNAGWVLRVITGSGRALGLTAGGVADLSTSGFGLTGGRPYFVAASTSTAVNRVNYLARDLISGQQTTNSLASSSSSSAPNGTYLIGNDFANQSLNQRAAAAMFSARYMTMPELLQWSADPWLLWYAPTAETQVLSPFSGSGIPFRRSSSPLGTRAGSRQAA